MTSIINYLTPKSSPYYEKVQMVVSKLADIMEHPIVIYGGMVRDIITHYYEYQRDNSVEFIEPNDVDLHVCAVQFASANCIHGKQRWLQQFKCAFCTFELRTPHIMSPSKSRSLNNFSMNSYNYMMKKLWDNKMVEKI